VTSVPKVAIYLLKKGTWNIIGPLRRTWSDIRRSSHIRYSYCHRWWYQSSLRRYAQLRTISHSIWI